MQKSVQSLGFPIWNGQLKQKKQHAKSKQGLGKGRKEKTNFSRVLVHGFVNGKCQNMTGSIFFLTILQSPMKKKSCINYYNPTEH